MVGIGAITPDESMESYLRMAADLPERDPETTFMTAKPSAAARNREEDDAE